MNTKDSPTKKVSQDAILGALDMSGFFPSFIFFYDIGLRRKYCKGLCIYDLSLKSLIFHIDLIAFLHSYLRSTLKFSEERIQGRCLLYMKMGPMS